ncbi:TPA: hypothetical protein ACX6QF_001479 [Photobacterium damselae]
MSFEKEFKTVDLLLALDHIEHPTKMVDAFSLSRIKAERQVRKIFTYLVFQNTHLTSDHVNELRSVLAEFKNVYFEGFINGINVLSNKSLEELYGENYEESISNLENANNHRNKIFHGQLTNEKLGCEDLDIVIENIKQWCFKLSDAAQKEYGYCGFGRNSFQKSNSDISKNIITPINNPSEYRQFINDNMIRPVISKKQK